MKTKLLKSVYFVFLPMLFLAMVFVLSACGEKAHTHSWGEWEVVTNSTCTQNGEEHRFCSGCNEEEKRTIPAAHSWGEWEIIQQQNCTTDGKKYHKCTVCGFDETVIEQAKGHQILITSGKPATCTEPGYTDKIECSVCGLVIQEQSIIFTIPHQYGKWIANEDYQDGVCNSTHSRFCEFCHDEEVGVCDYKTTTTPPTCLQGGYSIHECKICGFSFEHDQTEPTNHNLSEVYTPAGLNLEGKYVHTRACMNKDCTYIETSVCEYGQPVHTDATCEENGFDTLKCTKCFHEKLEINEEATGHSYGNWEYSAEHSQDGKHRHKHECENCQKVETELCGEETDFKSATCDEENGAGHNKVFCPTCNNVTLNEQFEPIEHTWSNWETTGTSKTDSKHKHSCEVCGKEEENVCGGWTTETQDATCTQAEQVTEHCEVCQAAYTSQGKAELGHQYNGYDFIGLEEGVRKHQQVCTRCGHTEKSNCVETEDFRQDASCSATGLVKYSCTYCKNEESEVLQKTQHIWVEEGSEEDINEWTITDNDHTHTCKKCGEVETLPHTYTSSNLCSACNYDALVYEIKNNSYAVVRHDIKIDKNPLVTKIIIATHYKNLPVTEIESGLTIEKSETSQYGGWSCGFNSNTNIKEVVLPYTLKTINSYAFYNCTNLTTVSVDTSKGESQLTTIDNFAFSLCGKLEQAHLPSGLLRIGKSAFVNCAALNDISIPDSVVEIGDHAFSGTAYIKDMSNWTDNKALYINSHLIKAVTNLGNEYTITSGTKTISAEAFMDCTNLQKIVLPATLLEVGNDAFKNCTSLNCVEFEGTFAQWISVKFANDYASPMAYSNFLDIKGATGTIDIPEGTTAVPAGAFKGSTISSIHIPASVTSIGEEAFEGCSQLATITVDENCKLEYVGLNAFKDTPFYENAWVDGALYVGHCLVETNYDIAENFVVQEGTVSIATKAFYNNTKLKSIVIAEDVVYIGVQAFEGCTNLTSAKFLAHTGWMGFNLQGAGRGTSNEIDATDPKTAQSKMEAAARLLTRIYTSYWRRTVKK